ncbi:LysM peptidoglycan-binding domain-containing protein [Arthrobacter sp. H14-L1]|uniref:LysM peptidoglycan-binding domain-containing protein n=1 Tax=Arthrobacter sp. H14-L1 TaxID=2996697 RepID=UPI003B63FE4C
MTVNQGIDPYRIVPGQSIDIPDELLVQQAAPAPAGPPSCIVESGDTLSGISEQFGVPMERS